MRARWPVLVLAGLLAAGCAEPSGAPPASAPAPVVAYVDAPEESGRNRTLLVLRAGEEADRLTYVDDGSWLPRLAPGLEYPADAMRSVFPAAGSPERGGVVVRVERGVVPLEARAALGPFLAGAWPVPFQPSGEVDPWSEPVVMGRAAPVAQTQLPPEGARRLGAEHADLAALHAAFEQARGAFVPRLVQETPAATPAGWTGCLRAGTGATLGAAPAGEPVNVVVDLTNCGAAPATLDPSRCEAAPSVRVEIAGWGQTMRGVLPLGERPRAAYAHDFRCRGDAPPVTVAAGATERLAARWNGTFAACGDAGGCEYRPAPPGQYAAIASATGQQETTPTLVAVMPEDPPTTRLLLVRETDRVDASGSGYIEGRFGPHCAPVGYTRAPPSLAVYHYDARPEVGAAVVVRDFRDGPRPEHTSTMSADRVDVVYLESDQTTLTSPYDANVAYANVTLDAEGWIVDGVRLAPGAPHAVRTGHVVERDRVRFVIESALEFEDAGETPVLFVRVGGCA